MKQATPIKQRYLAALLAFALAYVVYFLTLLNLRVEFANVALVLVLFLMAFGWVNLVYIAVAGTLPAWLEKALADFRR